MRSGSPRNLGRHRLLLRTDLEGLGYGLIRANAPTKRRIDACASSYPTKGASLISAAAEDWRPAWEVLFAVGSGSVQPPAIFVPLKLQPMSKLKSLWNQIKDTSAQASEQVQAAAGKLKAHVDENQDTWRDSALRLADQGKKASETFVREATKKTAEQARSLYVSARYSRKRLKELENSVENQGAA